MIKTYNRKVQPGDTWIGFQVGWGDKELLESVSAEFRGTIVRPVHAEAYVAKDLDSFGREQFITRKRWIISPDDPSTWVSLMEYNRLLEVPYNLYMCFSPQPNFEFHGNIKFQVKLG